MNALPPPSVPIIGLSPSSSTFDYDASSDLKDINDMLLQQLATLSMELDTYKNQDPLAGAGISAVVARDVREAKVKELAKKNRDILVKYEKERNKATTVAAQLEAVSAELVSLKEAVELGGEASRAAAEHSRVQSEMREWQRKAKHTEGRELEIKARLEESRRECERLKAALVREAGDDVPVAKIIAGEAGDWRGRAQQLQILRDKLRELKNNSMTTGTFARTGASSMSVPEGAGLPSRAAAYAPTSKHLDKLAATRASADDKRMQELLDAREQVAALKQKLDAAVSRRKVLEESSKDLKSSVAKLLAKSDNDDKLIATLKAKMGTGGGGGGGVSAKMLEDRIRHKDAQISRQELIICSLIRQLEGK